MIFELFVLHVIQGHPCLFDKSDVGFENDAAREIAYDAIKNELKQKYYTIPDLFTTEFVDKFVNEILVKAPNKHDAAKLAKEKFGDVKVSFETELESVMANYPNLWNKSNPDYNNENIRKESFREIAKALKKNHHFLKAFIDEDFVEYAWKTKVKIIEESSLC